MTTNLQPSPTPMHALLAPDLPLSWRPEHGPVLVLDSRPSTPHGHCCTSLRCQGRTWICSAPHCDTPPGQPCCEGGAPPLPTRQSPTLRVRHMGYGPNDAGTHERPCSGAGLQHLTSRAWRAIGIGHLARALLEASHSSIILLEREGGVWTLTGHHTKEKTSW
jgi:hypothetical protein